MKSKFEKKLLIVSYHNWYENRLKYIKKIALEQEFEITFVSSDFSHLRKAYCTKDELLGVDEVIHSRKYKRNISIGRIFSYLDFSFQAKKVIRRYSPNIVYAVIPPNYLARTCIKLKKEIGCKLIFDIVDMWPESFPVDAKLKKSFPFILWKNIRNKSLTKADFVITECEYYQNELKAFLAQGKYCSLYLTKDQSPLVHDYVASTLKSNFSRLKDNEIKLCYLGSINHIIDINAIREVVSCLISKSFKVSVDIIGDGETREEIIKEIRQAGANVEFHGKIYDDMEKAKILSSCDFALNLMKSSVYVGLTTKSIDYFSYGLPLINNIKGDTYDLVEREGIGVNFDNAEKFLSFIFRMTNRSNLLDVKMKVLNCFDRYFSTCSINEKLLKLPFFKI